VYEAQEEANKKAAANKARRHSKFQVPSSKFKAQSSKFKVQSSKLKV
jgi:hypothetical protein